MKFASLAILFLFTLILNFCQCSDKDKIIVIIDGKEESPNLKEVDVYTTEAVGISLVAVPLAAVIATIKYYYHYANGYKTTEDQEIVITGSRLKITRNPDVSFVHVQLTPQDPDNFEVSPSLIRIFFEPFNFERIITPDEQAAVAQELAISGKITDLTTI